MSLDDEPTAKDSVLSRSTYPHPERAVFRLQPGGVELIELAPGLDLQRDILDQMEFVPIIREVRPMAASLFGPVTALPRPPVP